MLFRSNLDGTGNLAVAADSTFSINPAALAAGGHVLTIAFANSTGTKTTTANFTVNAVVTPDVNVSTNITTVVNLTDNVIITAGNASGGGSNPLYTFAKDKAFTNVLQAEGAANTLTMAPATLTIGSNWIYVRMKTSSSCYTVQTNVDSIKIDRSSITGLVDIDNPGRIINVYPNPFKQGINISGLSTGKTYMISISDVTGKLIYQQRVSNSAGFSIDGKALAGGSYWLHVYDVTKNRLIGVSPLIRQ